MLLSDARHQELSRGGKLQAVDKSRLDTNKKGKIHILNTYCIQITSTIVDVLQKEQKTRTLLSCRTNIVLKLFFTATGRGNA